MTRLAFDRRCRTSSPRVFKRLTYLTSANLIPSHASSDATSRIRDISSTKNTELQAALGSISRRKALRSSSNARTGIFGIELEDPSLRREGAEEPLPSTRALGGLPLDAMMFEKMGSPPIEGSYRGMICYTLVINIVPARWLCYFRSIFPDSAFLHG